MACCFDVGGGTMRRDGLGKRGAGMMPSGGVAGVPTSRQLSCVVLGCYQELREQLQPGERI